MVSATFRPFSGEQSVMVDIEINADEPYWPAPSLPGGLILHWSDPWGNGDLYETPAGDWFLWRGFETYKIVSPDEVEVTSSTQPMATAISQTEARIWLRLAKRRQHDRAMRANERAIEEERAAEAKRKRDEERREHLDRLCRGDR